MRWNILLKKETAESKTKEFWKERIDYWKRNKHVLVKQFQEEFYTRHLEKFEQNLKAAKAY